MADLSFFNANDGTTGNELWVSDGTEAGTHIVKNIRPGAQGSSPSDFVQLGNKLLFAASDGTNGIELWVSDGTDAGTTLLKNINPDGGNGLPNGLTLLGNLVIFQAFNGSDGRELWVTDGTEAGTMQIMDIKAGGGGSDPSGFAVINGVAVFSADDGINGAELWVTDGTTAGTTLLKDIGPGSNGSIPTGFTQLGNNLLFDARGPEGGELWITDGTQAGTMLVKDINPGSDGSYPSEFTRFNGKTYFNAYDAASGTELWVTDGTAIGTELVQDINPGAGSSDPSHFAALSAALIFSVTTPGLGNELGFLDAFGNLSVKDLNSGGGSSEPTQLVRLGNQVIFVAHTPGVGNELWVTGFNPGSATLLLDINPGAASSDPHGLVRVGNSVVFSATDDTHGTELWITDGTPGGTRLVKDVATGGDSNPSNLFSFYDSNTAPTLGGNTGLTVNEGESGAITASKLDYDDAEQARTSLVFKITSAPTHGAIYYLSSPLGAGDTFTQADIDNFSISYTHDGSETTNDSFGFSVSDGQGGGVTGQTFDFSINPQNDAPTVDLNDADSGNDTSFTYAENDPLTAAAPGAVVSDIDSADFDSATLTVSVGGSPSINDRLGIITGGDFSVSSGTLSYQGNDIATVSGGTDGSTPLVVTFSGAIDASVVQALVRAIGFSNVSDAPSTDPRSVDFVLTDGDGGTGVAVHAVVTVTPQNDAPSGASGTITIKEDIVTTLTAASFGFSDPDGDSLGSVKITALPNRGQLYYDADGINTGNNPVAVTLNQVISGADVAAGLLTYLPQGNANGTNNAHFNFLVADGSGATDSASKTLTFDITPVNDKPFMSSIQFARAEHSAFTISAASLQSSYFDYENDSIASFIIVNAPTDPGLTFDGVAVTTGMEIAWADIVAGKLVFTTPSTNTILFNYGSFEFQVRDTGGTADGGNDLSDAKSLSFQVQPTNDAPASTGLAGDSVAFTEDGSAVKLDASLDAAFTDADSADFSGGSLRVAITANKAAGEDQLGFATGGNVTLAGNVVSVGGTSIGTFSGGGAGGGDLVFTLNANATPARIATLVHELTYFNSNTLDPSTADRTITYTLVDGDGASNGGNDTLTQISTVTITAQNDAPVLANAGTVSYAEQAAAVVVDSGITLVDDSASIASATVSISAGRQAGDTLAADVTGTSITAGYDASTGVLTLSGSDTAAHYQQVLASVTFANATNEEPTVGGASRTIAFVTNDGSIDSNILNATVNVTAVNDAPVFGPTTFGITRVSTDSAGAQAAGQDSQMASFSPDGAHVAFYSNATNLVANDTNARIDLFLKDLVTGAVTLLSTATGGAQGTAGTNAFPVGSWPASFSPDGTQVAFSSTLNGLVAGDAANEDVFIKTLSNNSTFGIGGSGTTAEPVFSPDGNKLMFASTATNLVAGDTNSSYDIFIYDGSTVTRVSTTSAGAQATGGVSQNPSWSPDGTKIIFGSAATNLVAGDTNTFSDLFIKDLNTGVVTRVSTDAAGAQATGGDTIFGYFSPDGTKVLFASAATNLVSGDTNARTDLFVKDLTTGAITRVTTDSSGNQTTGGTNLGVPTWSPDGTKVLFSSDATDLVAGDTNAVSDLFVKDLVTGTTTRVSTDASGAQQTGGTGSSGRAYFSPDGTQVVFSSSATNLVAGDTNAKYDVFVASLASSESTIFSENGTARIIAPYVTASDSDSATYAGGTLTVAVTGNAVAGDTIGLFTAANPNFGLHLSGSNVTFNGVTVGTLSTGSASISVALNASATDAAVKAIAGAATFSSTSDNPTSATRTVTFTLQDGAGTGGGGADTASFTRDIRVTPQNDAPSGTDTTIAVNEDTGRALTAADFAFADAEGNALASVKITALPGAGQLLYDADGAGAGLPVAVTLNQVVTRADIDAGKLSFVPAATVSGTGYTTIGFQVQDDGGTAGGGADTDATPNTITVDVTPVNDAPVFNSPAYQSARVSTAQDGTQGNAASTLPIAVDATHLLFTSAASNLVTGDTNGFADAFVKDLTTGAVVRASVLANGTQANANVTALGASADGTKILFITTATNLVAADTNTRSDIYVKDLTTGAVTLVSSTQAGVVASNISESAAISADGTKVAFSSWGSNLIGSDTNNRGDIFVKDLATGTVTRVSTTAGGGEANDASSAPVFSPDGTKLLFSSDATNLVGGDTNSTTDLFLKDLVTGAISRVNVSTAGAQVNAGALNMAFSPDGTKVAFSSASPQLVGSDNNGGVDVFVRDLVANTTVRVSTNSAGVESSGGGIFVAWSPDGGSILFRNPLNSLVAGDSNGTDDLFLKNLSTGVVTRVSYGASGQLNGAATDAAFLTNNSLVFSTTATNSGIPDANGTAYDLIQGTNLLGSPPATFVENGSAVLVTTGVNLSDDNANFGGGSLTVAITANGGAGDTLGVSATGSAGTGLFRSGNTLSWNGTAFATLTDGTTSLSFALTSGASVAAVQALSQAITFANSSENPSTAARDVTFTLVDGGGVANGGADTASFVRAVNVAGLIDPPVLDLNGATAGTGSSIGYAENDAATAMATAATLVDVDSADFDTGTLTVSFTGNGAAEDRLTILATGGITTATNVVSYNGTAIGTFAGGTSGSTPLVVTLNASADAAAAQALVRAIAYLNVSDTPSTLVRTVQFSLTDGDGGTSTGVVASVSVSAVNDTPVVTVATPVASTEQVAGSIAPTGTIADADLDARNGGLGNYGGATLSVVNSAGADAADLLRLGASGAFTVSGNALQAGGLTFATFSGGNGSALAISFTSSGTPATTALVNAVLQAIQYTYTGDTPPAGIDLAVSLNDGAPGNAAQGSTAGHSATGTTIVHLDVTDTSEAVADTGVSVAENATVAIDVLANDTIVSNGAPTDVTRINGQAIATNGSVVLASGAKVTLNGDGTLTYDPNGKFGYLVSPPTGTATSALDTAATDSFSYTLTGGGTSSVTVTVNGVTSAGDQLRGDGGDNTINGTNNSDFFNLSQGGTDIANGGGGNDGFYFTGGLDAGDVIDGGTGTDDQVGLQGNFTYTFGASNLLNIETLALISGHDATFGDTSNANYAYNLTTVDANVAAGTTLTVNGNNLAAGENLTFNGSAETDGKFLFYAGKGVDSLTGGQQNDAFFFGEGQRFTAADHVDGQGGTDDQLGLRGDYSSQVVFGATTMVNIETLAFISASDTSFAPGGTTYSYNVKLHDGNVAAGATLNVAGNNLRTGENITVDGSSELDGHFRIVAGAGNDTLTGGALSDQVYGRAGQDSMTGGGGNDTFYFIAATDSATGAMDQITDFTVGDLIDLSLIDADTGTGGNQAFAFLGTGAFTSHAGEAHVTGAGASWTLEVDTDGNGVADMAVAITTTGGHTPIAADFIL